MSNEYKDWLRDKFFDWAWNYCPHSGYDCNISKYVWCYKCDENCIYNPHSECYKQFKEDLGRIEI